MADLASKNTDSVTKAFQAGLISQKVALKELRQQSEQTGMWTNIGDKDIENADDEVMNPDEGMELPLGMGSEEDFSEAMKERPEPQKTNDATPNGEHWVTINGAKVLVDGDGNIVAGAGGKINKKGSTASRKPAKITTSAQGANKFTKYGFMNRNKEKEHEKHLSEFEDITTMEQYIARGMALVQMPVGGDILGHKDKNEIITRYNVRTNEFVKGRPDRGIYTFYKPKDKKKYYDVMKRKDLENGGSE